MSTVMPPRAEAATAHEVVLGTTVPDIAALFERLQPLLLHRLRTQWRFAPDVAEDLAQDAWTKALRALPSFRPGTRFEPWILTILDRTAIDHLRATRDRDGRLRVTATDDSAVIDTAHEVTGAVEDREAIRQALAALPGRQREALHLSLVEGHSAREAGTRMGVNENAFRQLLHRANRTAKAQLTLHRLRALLPIMWLRLPRRPDPSSQPALLAATNVLAAATLVLAAATPPTHAESGGRDQTPPAPSVTSSIIDEASGAVLEPLPAAPTPPDGPQAPDRPAGTEPSATVTVEEPRPSRGGPPPLADLPPSDLPVTGHRVDSRPYEAPAYDYGVAVPVPNGGELRSGVQVDGEPETEPADELACGSAASLPSAYCHRNPPDDQSRP
jgi:RNA polymerase sigma-70 factor (ECF subfamily)